MDLPTAEEAAPGRPVAPAGRRPGALDRAFVRATALTAAGAVVLGVLGTFGTRRWGEVPFSVPAPPWYLSWPYYIFWSPRLDLAWALAALPVAVLALAAALALATGSRSRIGAAPPSPAGTGRGDGAHRGYVTGSLARVPGPVRLAGWVGCTAVLALAVAALRGGPSEWRVPLAYPGEYPDAVDEVGAIPTFLGEFAARVPGLPDFVAQHPPGATAFYLLVDRVWAGLDAAALATTAAAALGVLVVFALAGDELGEAGGRWAAVCWLAGPLTVLYAATAADAMWAPVLAGGALAAHRGLERRSWPWTAAGGVLLWAASMMTFAAVLVLPFLAVRALARVRAERAWVLAWAAGTSAVVVGLAALCWLATGYDPFAAVAAVNRFWSVAPGTNRVYWIWIFGNLLAFTGMLGFPLAAGLLVGTWKAVRERAWGSFEVGMLACLLAGALWGHTKGEVERMWQFLVPFAVVVAVRQLRAWRVPLPLVAALLVGQAVAVQVLFTTRW